MASSLRIGILSSIITAALVYVVVEWRPSPATSANAGTAETITTGSEEITAPISDPMPQANAIDESPPPPSAIRNVTTDQDNNVDIYRRYSRSVVNVASTTYTRDFFYRPIPSEGFGSGVVIDDEGHIVTNYHVIRNPRAELEVTLWDQSRYPARLVGADPNNDLAVVKVDAPDLDWVPVPMGVTRGLQVGQKVLAIGNPFGLERTLTTGIISSLGRAIQAPSGGIIEGVIQTDAAINQGNSGGPLLNAAGELIGINTAMVSGSTGIGLAVPVDTVKRVTGDLLTYGRVRRATLGVDADTLDKLGRDVVLLDLGTTRGMLIINVHNGGAAAAAGLRGATRTAQVGNYVVPTGGDVIITIDGRNVRTQQDIDGALDARRPGDKVMVRIVRDGQEMEVEVTLQEQPV
jgi:putative serine protease PepD